MRRSVYFLLIIVVTAGCFLLISMGGKEKLKKATLRINDIEIIAELADTPKARQTGLMNRKTLEKNCGMLFIFERDQKLSFWMKNTYIPLTIAYLSSDGVIMEIHDLEPESLRPVESRISVRYALEMNRGWFENNGVKIGDKVFW